MTKHNNRIQEFGYRVPRFPADFHFLLQINDPEPRVLDAQCTDISCDGLAAKMAEGLSVGTQVTLMLSLPGQPDILRIGGRVSHQHNREHGFAFLFTSQRERESIQKYVSSFRTRTVGLRPSR
ncbi:MAG TPA: PilZ domain-containing protein [Terriglobales bacterium]|nr:PilZ domain-containing protein [Terriglobales bacterium]